MTYRRDSPGTEMLRAAADAATSIFDAIGATADIVWFAAYRKKRDEEESIRMARLTTERDTQALHDETARRIQHAAFPPFDDFMGAAYERYAHALADAGFTAFPVHDIRRRMFTAVGEMYQAEELSKPPLLNVVHGTIEAARYRDHLLDLRKRLADPAITIDICTRAFMASFVEMAKGLPQYAFDTDDDAESSENATSSIPVVHSVPDLGEMIWRSILPFFSPEVIDLGLFASFRKQFNANQLEASGGDPNALLRPQDYDGDPEEIVHAFLKGTYLGDIFNARVPFEVPERARMEHTVIVAGSGWGKTQLLQSLIANDIQREDPPSLIVLDSTGAMIERIQKLALFDGKLRDRILIIDPAQSPSLNMFDVSTPRFERYSDDQKEDVQTEVIGLFNYIFASESYDLTAHMGLAFSYAIRLMLSRKGSTITDLRRILEEPPSKTPGFAHSAFKADIEKLDQDTQDFFAQHFFSASLAGARAAIARRMHNLIAVPAFRRMFTASANTLDLFAEMQKGTIILVNTNQQLLKDDAMVLFGRFVIAKALSAALERATVPVGERRPAYLIVDEAAPYFDPTFESLLTRVRQFKLGVVIAFQHLEQASEKLRSAIASSTSIKYAGGLGFSDRRWLAREMETSPEFIGAQRKDSAEPPKWSQFALYVRNYTPKALSLTIPFFTLERMPTMSGEAHGRLLDANKRRVASIATPEPKPPEPVIVQPTLPARPQEGSDEAGYY